VSASQSLTFFIQNCVYPPGGDSSTPTTPVSPQRTVAISSNASPIVSEAPGASVLFNDASYVVEDHEVNDEALVRDFDRDGAQGAEELFGFDKDGLEDDAEEEEWNLAGDGKPAEP
jgi:hypothetical protein